MLRDLAFFHILKDGAIQRELPLTGDVLSAVVKMKTRLPGHDPGAADSATVKAEKGYVSSERIRTWPTNERSRERLLTEGPERLTDAELLAIILRVGIGTFKEGVPGKNVYETALSILRDFRGLRGLDRARIRELLKVPGLGPAKVAQIKAAFELGKRVCAGKLTAPAFESSKAAADHYRPRLTRKRKLPCCEPSSRRSKPPSTKNTRAPDSGSWPTTAFTAPTRTIAWPAAAR